MSAEPGPSGPTPQERAISLYGEQLLSSLATSLEDLSVQLIKHGALGLIVVDATPLAEIERRYGARAFRKALKELVQRIETRVVREVGRDFLITAGALAEEHLLLFFPRPRDDSEFYVKKLPWLAEELRGYVGICLKRIAYPYLYRPIELPVGSGLALYRPFQRPETEMRRLVESTLQSAPFPPERAHPASNRPRTASTASSSAAAFTVLFPARSRAPGDEAQS